MSAPGHLVIFAIELSDSAGQAEVKVVKAPSTSVASRTQTRAGRARLALRFLPAGGQSYFHSARCAVLTSVTVDEVSHYQQPHANENESLVVDSQLDTAEHRDSGGATLRDIQVVGSWPRVAPGDDEFVILAVDSAPTYPTGEQLVRDRTLEVTIKALPAD